MTFGIGGPALAVVFAGFTGWLVAAELEPRWATLAVFLVMLAGLLAATRLGLQEAQRIGSWSRYARVVLWGMLGLYLEQHRDLAQLHYRPGELRCSARPDGGAGRAAGHPCRDDRDRGDATALESGAAMSPGTCGVDRPCVHGPPAMSAARRPCPRRRRQKRRANQWRQPTRRGRLQGEPWARPRRGQRPQDKSPRLASQRSTAALRTGLPPEIGRIGLVDLPRPGHAGDHATGGAASPPALLRVTGLLRWDRHAARRRPSRRARPGGPCRAGVVRRPA